MNPPEFHPLLEVVSIFFEQNESAESELFSYMGFPKARITPHGGMSRKTCRVSAELGECRLMS